MSYGLAKRFRLWLSVAPWKTSTLTQKQVYLLVKHCYSLGSRDHLDYMISLAEESKGFPK